MALTSEEKAALSTLTSDVSQIAVELYATLMQVRAADGTNFSAERAFELTKILTAYAVNETDDA
jgi:hypothetical protein